MWKLIRLAGAAAVLVGIAGLVVTVGPALRGQPRRTTLPGLSGLFGGSEIGIVVRDVEDTDVRRDHLATTLGAVVQEVRATSPADTAGLHAGDVVVTFDGQRVRNARDLTRLVGDSATGREAALSLVRAGQPMDLKISPVRGHGLSAIEHELRNLNPREDLAFARSSTNSDRPQSVGGIAPGRARLGVEVQEINDQLAVYFAVPQGVLVTQVAASTPARTAGLKAGDVITSVNDHPVRNADELRRLLNDAPAVATIAITRDRKVQTVKVDLSEPVER